MTDIRPADDAAVRQLWSSYVEASRYDGPLVTTFEFGDSAEMADELGALVLHGPKRATAGLLADYEADGEALPQVGEHCVVAGGDGLPLAVVRTTDVRVGPLSSVDDAFAWDEGEGDRSRSWWLDAHTRFFGRRCAQLGLDFSEEILVVFERFEVVWPPVGSAPSTLGPEPLLEAGRVVLPVPGLGLVLEEAVLSAVHVDPLVGR